MADLILTGGGREYRHFTITADHDITGKTAQVSFSSPYAEAPDAPFRTAETVSVVQVGTQWVLTARLLFTLEQPEQMLLPGIYRVFGQLIDSPERPIEPMGYLRVA